MSREVVALGQCCQHTEPITRPCDPCRRTIVDRIRSMYEATLTERVNEKTAQIADELNKAKLAEAKVTERLARLSNELATAHATRQALADLLKTRIERVKDLELQLLAEKAVQHQRAVGQ